jgi:hypothetical protein
MRLLLRADYPPMTMVQKQSERFGTSVDMQGELIHKALELRQKRLDRVRQEIIAVYADSQLDPEDARYYSQVAVLTNNAKRLIDDEISRQARKVNA